jgi:hypothetical protein
MCVCMYACMYDNNSSFFFQRPNQIVAIKAITKKNLAKSQNLLGKEIKILKVSCLLTCIILSAQWPRIHLWSKRSSVRISPGCMTWNWDIAMLLFVTYLAHCYYLGTYIGTFKEEQMANNIFTSFS